MDTEQKWREVFESVEGNCWHRVVSNGTGLHFGPGYVPPMCSCGKPINRTMSRTHDNPPLTLDALKAVMLKLGASGLKILYAHGYDEPWQVRVNFDYKDSPFKQGADLENTFLLALHQAIFKSKHKPMFPGPSMEGPLNDV